MGLIHQYGITTTLHNISEELRYHMIWWSRP